MDRDTSRKEAMGIVLFFVAIIIILIFYLPDALTGIIGLVIKSFFLGLIGVAAYAIPVYILYVALDVFFEKRQGVSRIRVRSVILLLVSVSALLALISMDMDYFESLCTNSSGNSSALKALYLLWESGSEAVLITNPVKSSSVLTGGIIGGSIAVALYEVTGKVIGMLTIIVFLLTQILLVFRVSIKATAKKTAHAIGAASSKVYNSVVSHKGQEDPGYRIYSGNGYGNHEKQRAGQIGTDSALSLYRNNELLSNGRNTTTFGQNVGHSPMMQGPFLTNIPIDGETGFTDIDRMTSGQIHPVSQAQGRLAYKDNEYDVSDTTDASADFSYTTDPLSVPDAAKIRKKVRTPSFLDSKKADFYELSQGGVDDQDYDPSGELYEITENPIDSSDCYSEPERKVRQPYVDKALLRKLDMDGHNVPQKQQTVYVSYPESKKDDEDSEKNGKYAEHIIQVKEQQKKIIDLKNYVPAPSRLLVTEKRQQDDKELNNRLKAKARQLEEAIANFGVNVKVVGITHGPRITRFEITIDPGVKLARITNLQKDIMLAMAAKSINIEAPIPGTSAIGIEVPNEVSATVHIRPLLETEKFKKSAPLMVALGRDIAGTPMYCDIAKMPHLMIAGSTGSGKSVCLNSILTSILVHSSPADVRMILIDPKRVEFIIYNGIPHLIMPVITDAMKAAGALNWALTEMERRYELFEEAQVKDIKNYNEKYKNDPEAEHLPLILIVIDELADIMLVAAKEVEVYISRLAALARASGIHLIIATQRPDVKVITGTIKANISSRIALATVSGIDSRTILDREGAEKLLGYGDMLYAPMNEPEPIRGQGAWVDDKEETPAIVNYLKTRYGTMYDESIIKDIDRIVANGYQAGNDMPDQTDNSLVDDELFEQAVITVIENGSASTSLLQRRLGLGYPKAGRLIDELQNRQIIGPLEGSKPRKVLITMTEWLEMKDRNL